jgi:hypothetical protein
MADLCFKGPFHFDHLHNPKTKQGQYGNIKSLDLSQKSGIYIWGFMYDLENNQLINPIDFSEIKTEIPEFIFEKNSDNENVPIGVNCVVKEKRNWKFIPYYVGLDAHLPSRVISHHKITTGNSKKYTRLKINRYKDFFKIGNFPIFIKGQGTKQRRDILNHIINKNNPIDYFNNYFILKEIHSELTLSICPGLKELWNDLPIDICKWNNKTDSLEQIIINQNNFWFCYAELPSNDPATPYMEAQTYYSVKGITISETLDYTSNAGNFVHKINPSKTCEDIFKRVNNNIFSSNHFLGYLDFDNKFQHQIDKYNKLSIKYSSNNLICEFEFDSEKITNIFQIDIETIKNLEIQEVESVLNDYFNQQCVGLNELVETINGDYQPIKDYFDKYRGKYRGKKFGI